MRVYRPEQVEGELDADQLKLIEQGYLRPPVKPTDLGLRVVAHIVDHPRFYKTGQLVKKFGVSEEELWGLVRNGWLGTTRMGSGREWWIANGGRRMVGRERGV